MAHIQITIEVLYNYCSILYIFKPTPLETACNGLTIKHKFMGNSCFTVSDPDVVTAFSMATMFCYNPNLQGHLVYVKDAATFEMVKAWLSEVCIVF